MAVKVTKNQSSSFESRLPMLEGIIISDTAIKDEHDDSAFPLMTLDEIKGLHTGILRENIIVPTCTEYPTSTVDRGNKCKIVRSNNRDITIGIPGVPCLMHVDHSKVSY